MLTARLDGKEEDITRLNEYRSLVGQIFSAHYGHLLVEDIDETLMRFTVRLGKMSFQVPCDYFWDMLAILDDIVVNVNDSKRHDIEYYLDVKYNELW